jgi:hypothetical protein
MLIIVNRVLPFFPVFATVSEIGLGGRLLQGPLGLATFCSVKACNKENRGWLP